MNWQRSTRQGRKLKQCTAGTLRHVCRNPSIFAHPIPAPQVGKQVCVTQVHPLSLLRIVPANIHTAAREQASRPLQGQTPHILDDYIALVCHNSIPQLPLHGQIALICDKGVVSICHNTILPDRQPTTILNMLLVDHYLCVRSSSTKPRGKNMSQAKSLQTLRGLSLHLSMMNACNRILYFGSQTVLHKPACTRAAASLRSLGEITSSPPFSHKPQRRKQVLRYPQENKRSWHTAEQIPHTPFLNDGTLVGCCK